MLKWQDIHKEFEIFQVWEYQEYQYIKTVLEKVTLQIGDKKDF